MCMDPSRESVENKENGQENGFVLSGQNDSPSVPQEAPMESAAPEPAVPEAAKEYTATESAPGAEQRSYVAPESAPRAEQGSYVAPESASRAEQGSYVAPESASHAEQRSYIAPESASHAEQPKSVVSEDGTYSYSSRKAVENPDEYRKPSYMRDEIPSGGTQSGDPQIVRRPVEFKGLSSGENRGDNGNAGRSSYGSGNPGNGERMSYGSGNGGNHGGNGGNGNYYGGPSNGTGRNPKKPNKKLIAGVVIGCVAVGALIAGACWSIGSLVGHSSSVSSAQATIASSDAGAAAETSAAAESGASSETQGAATIQTAPSSEGSSDSVVVSDVSDVVEKALPSVVAITTKTVYDNYSNGGNNPFYYYYYGNSGNSGSYEVEGAGSGIIIGDDGTELWIVTNNHVVEDSDELTVSFCDGNDVSAYIKGTDPDNDLAVVGVKLSDISNDTQSAIQAIQMGDSDSLRLGESVIAIGNALGIGQSVTTGVVSALNREITTEENTTLTTIQTDAAINPGNSGGALLNSSGELIGINVAKDSEVDVEGMGYAIPISSAKDIIENLTTMEPKTAVSEDEYPYLGVQLKDIDSTVAAAYGMPTGVLVYAVEEDTPAADAGMMVQDIITKFNGVTVSSYDDLTEQLQYYAGGTEVTVTVKRLENGSYEEKELTVKLGLRSDYVTDSDSSSGTSGDNSNSQDNGGSFGNYGNGSNGYNYSIPGFGGSGQ